MSGGGEQFAGVTGVESCIGQSELGDRQGLDTVVQRMVVPSPLNGSLLADPRCPNTTDQLQRFVDRRVDLLRNDLDARRG